MSVNDNDIINSGLLELYAAGALSDEERAQVEAVLAVDRNAVEELRRIESAIEQLAYTQKSFTRSGLRSKVLQAIDDAEEGLSTSNVSTSSSNAEELILIHASSTSTEHPEKNEAAKNAVYSLPPRRAYLAVASVAFIVGMLPGVYFYIQYKSATFNLESAKATIAGLQQNSSVMASKASYYEHTLGGMADTNVMRIKMPAVNNSHSHATVWWNSTTHEAMLDVASLPKIASDKDFQLWAIVDGKPVDMGVVNMQDGMARVVTMKAVSAPQAFAITVEPKGGLPSPTLNSMIVMGAVIRS